MDRAVERPLVYVAQRAPVKGGEDVLSGLNDEVLLAVLGLRSGVPDRRAPDNTENEVGTGGAVLRSVQRLLSRLSLFSDQSEMALVGVMPLGDRDRPLLVFHTYLRENGADEMRRLLESGAIAVKSRKLHDRQIYRFKTGAGESAALGTVEIALVDRDMVVSNDDKTLRRVLDPRTSASGGFATEKRYTRLRKRLDVPPGSLLVYADWRALAPSLDRVFGGDASWLMSFSGIESPEQLMFVAKPAPRKGGQKRGVITTFVLHHKSPNQRRTTTDSKIKWRPNGWLDLLKPARAQSLVASMPPGGVISFSAMFDLNRMLPTHRTLRMRRLQAAIFRACRRTGIDLRREVLRRLKPTGGAQLLLLNGQGESLRLAWSMQANSVSDAKDLFKVFQRMFVPQGSAKLVPVGGGQNELRFATRYAGGPMILTRANDTIAVAFSPDATEQVRRMTKERRRTPSYNRQSTALMSRLQRLGVGRQQKLAGVFGLDLSFLAKPGRKTSTSLDRFSGLLGLHGGFFQIEKDLIRLEVFTELDHP